MGMFAWRILHEKTRAAEEEAATEAKAAESPVEAVLGLAARPSDPEAKPEPEAPSSPVTEARRIAERVRSRTSRAESEPATTS
jgi:hypothetical protein